MDKQTSSATSSTSTATDNMKKTSVTSNLVTAATTTTVAAALSSSVRSRPVRFVQNFLLVWLDTKIDENNADFKNSFAQLRNVVNTVEVFTDVDQCFEYMESIKDEKIFLIVSGALGEKTVPLIHNMPQLDTIFVFCKNKDQHKQWAKNWSKIRRVSTTRRYS
ncbi:unnamed protein product [Rotaria sp. Silwood1]|nr:unnamed protein product [Rotaria sp. Silwood1]